MSRLKVVAHANFYRFFANPNPGHGIVMGVSEGGEHLVQIFFITDPDPLNRPCFFVVLAEKRGEVFTQPAKPNLTHDLDLVTCDAMKQDQSGTNFVVGNGNQTREILQNLGRSCFIETQEDFTYLPDEPHSTPRISGLISLDPTQPSFELSILRKGAWGMHCERNLFQYGWIERGYGYGIATYRERTNHENETERPSFRGEPILLPIEGNINEILETYWKRLDESNRISLAVKFIPTDGSQSAVRIINKFEPA